MFKSLFFALFWHLWLCWRASYFISDHLLLKNLSRTLNCTIGMFSEIAYRPPIGYFRLRRILVYSFCLIIIGLSLSIMKLIKWDFWILKEHNNFSYFWNLSPICQIVSEKFFFEKPPNLQRMYELINVLPPSNFAVFNWCYFLFYWLQRAETCTTA